MTATLARPLLPRAAVAAAALAAAALAGLLAAEQPLLAVGFLAAAVFVPLAFANPPLALAAWLVTAFLSGIAGTRGAGTNYALLVVFVAWVGVVAGGRSGLAAYARDQRLQLAAVLGFVAWAAATIAWAPDPAAGGASEKLMQLAIAVVAFLMVVSLVTRREHARWLAAAFVAGATLSVLAGAATGGLDPGATSGAALDDGRLAGATHDPNYLAATIVPAIALAAGLAAGLRRRPALRLLLGGAVVLLAIGLAATESRGGWLAALVVAAGALVLVRERRAAIIGFALVVAAGAALWFAASPGALERVTSVSDGGSGREDIWLVATRAIEDRPLFGAGLGQFPVVSPEYIREPGAISRSDLLIGQRIVVHNAYLQLWAEGGIVALALFLAVVAASLAAGLRAIRRFARAGDREMVALARAAVLATVGALVASIFLSNADDRRLWVLLALGPALLAIARRGART
ncbi:MAG TPA: O-antigen ligase family protein [Capillimicrobium sp.]|nr:O-antigen ligase family protein [Capillimicrobium sp.]